MLYCLQDFSHLSAANPTNQLHPAWSVCSLREWIYICPGFRVRSLCGILGFSISYTRYTQLSISSTSRSARVSCSATSLVLPHHFTCRSHPSPQCYRCPYNPSPTILLESSFRNTKHVTPVPSFELHGAPPFTHSSLRTGGSATLPFPPITLNHQGSSGLCHSWHFSRNALHIIHHSLWGNTHSSLQAQMSNPFHLGLYLAPSPGRIQSKD